MKKVFLLIAAALLLSVTPALAQGPYIGAGFVYNDPLGGDIRYLNPGPGLDFTFGYNFGAVALEGNLIGSRHEDTDPNYGHADFSGFSIDLRAFLSHIDDPNQVYLLFGFGSYSIDEYDPILRADTTLSGSGWNFGAGFEHYINEYTALNFGVIYRLIRYDEFDVDGTAYSLSPDENGDMLTFQAGVSFHW